MRTYREFFCRPSERSGLLGHLFLQGKSMSKVYISGKITDNENYVKDFEYFTRSQIVFYFRSNEAPDLQLIFPKKIDKTKVIF